MINTNVSKQYNNTLKHNIMKKRIILATIAVALIAGAAIFAACTKEDNKENKKTMGLTYHEKNVSDNDLPILIIRKGPKYQLEDGFYDCRGRKGICFLWFGGLFLVNCSDMMYANGISPNCQNGGWGTGLTDVQGAVASLELNDSLNMANMLIDYSCADSLEHNYWLEDVQDGFIKIYDDIVIDNEELLSSFGLNSPIVISQGNYSILNHIATLEQIYISVPYYLLNNDDEN